MVDGYPYLTHWKKTGTDKPPTIPPEVLLQRARDAFRKAFRKSSREKIKKSKLRNVLSEVLPEGTIDGLDSLDEEFAVILMEEDMDKIIADIYKRKLEVALIEEGRKSLNAQADFIYSFHDREEAKDYWAEQTLPHKQALPIKNIRRCLKNIYVELKDFIKYVSAEMDIKNAIYEDVHDFEEDAIERIPDILKVLDKNEIPLLVEQPSVRETAIKIIHRRISPSRWIMSNISPRTLADILDKTVL